MNQDVYYPDSDKAILENLKLSKNWKKYQINLKGKNLTRIKTPFWWSLKGSRESSVFYLDDLVIE